MACPLAFTFLRERAMPMLVWVRAGTLHGADGHVGRARQEHRGQAGEDGHGRVEPIYSTIDGESLVFLLRIKSDLGSDSYINLYTGDGGAFIYRSDETDEFEELLFDTEKSWTNF